jgi:hypothetical protein
MKQSKWIEEVREKLTELHIECDSSAAINDTEMSTFERLQLQKRLKEAIGYIDVRLARKKK